jgi:hypothetical protein
MPRYNTSLPNKTITGTTTIVTPDSGSFVQLVGTAPYTVTLPAPSAFPGQTLTFHNTTSGTVTLSTPSGAFTGLGASGTATQQVLPNTVASVISDSVNYVTLSEDGSVLFATDATITGNLTVNTPGTTTTISPANLTINPGNSGSVNNVNIGASTRGSGAFTSLTANSAVTLTANTTSSGTSSGTLVVTGGVGVSGTVHAGAFNGPLTGTLQTAAQPNITSVGSLTALTVNGVLTNSAGIQRYSVFVGQQGNVNRTYELMRVSRDTANWSTQITYEVIVNNQYYTGGRTRWLINYAVGSSTINCVEANGPQQLRCYFGTEVTVSGTIRYMPILVDMPNYQQMSIEVIHQSTVVSSTPNSAGQVQFTGTISAGTGSNYGGDIHLATTGGNVGINTISPAAKLDINQSSAAAGLRVYVNDVGTSNIVSFQGFDNSLGVVTRMVVQANGNIGINTTDFSAGYLFNVARSARFNGMMLGNGDGSNSADNRIAINWSSGTDAYIYAQQNVPLKFGVANAMKVQLDSNGNWIPAANDSQDLGSSSLAWRNVYTNDLHLNNETKVNGNDVDGTTGNWTIQEGAENLYIINNKTGKKFAFVLKELE